MLKHAESSW